MNRVAFYRNQMELLREALAFQNAAVRAERKVSDKLAKALMVYEQNVVNIPGAKALGAWRWLRDKPAREARKLARAEKYREAALNPSRGRKA